MDICVLRLKVFLGMGMGMVIGITQFPVFLSQLHGLCIKVRDVVLSYVFLTIDSVVTIISRYTGGHAR